MAFSPNFADLVRNYTTSTGTDDFVLGAAVNGFTSFTDACKVGDCFYYSAVAVDYPGDTEVGRGSLLDGGVISREPFNGTKTDFKSGTKSVSLVAAGEWFSEVEALRANGVGMINVKSFGAKGDSDRDGIAGTDDTAAIQAAIDHVGTTGGTLYFPAGIYKFSTTLRLANHVRYLGDGVDSAVTKGTVLKYTGTSDAIQINNPSNGSNNANISIENLAVHCTTVTPGKACIADNC